LPANKQRTNPISKQSVLGGVFSTKQNPQTLPFLKNQISKHSTNRASDRTAGPTLMDDAFSKGKHSQALKNAIGR
jgi:hypothetical protein